MITGKFIKAGRSILKLKQGDLASMCNISGAQKIIKMESAENICDEKFYTISRISKFFLDNNINQIISDDNLIIRYRIELDPKALIEIEYRKKIGKPIIFGEYFRAARNLANISQKQFSKIIKTSNSTLVELENINGLINYNDDFLNKILVFFEKRNITQEVTLRELIIKCPIVLDANDLIAIELEKRIAKENYEFYFENNQTKEETPLKSFG